MLACTRMRPLPASNKFTEVPVGLTLKCVLLSYSSFTKCLNLLLQFANQLGTLTVEKMFFLVLKQIYFDWAQTRYISVVIC